MKMDLKKSYSAMAYTFLISLVSFSHAGTMGQRPVDQGAVYMGAFGGGGAIERGVII